MSRLIALVALLSWQLLFSPCTQAQTEVPKRFEQLVVGSQSNAVIASMDIYRDTFGFMWIATYRGLARFDGWTMKLYEFKKPGGIDYGRVEVREIEPLDGRRLLLGTARKGLFILDSQTGDFEVYDERNGKIRNNHIENILADRHGHVWLSTPDGIEIMDADSLTITPYDPDTTQSSLPDGKIITFFEDSQGTIWVSAPSGLHTLKSWKSGQPVFERVNPETLPELAPIVAMEETEDGIFWLADAQGTLVQFDPKKKMITHRYTADPNDPTSLPHPTITDIHADDQGRIWIGTRNGLSLYREDCDCFHNFFARTGDATTLASSSLVRIIDDGTGNTYFAQSNGISFVTPYTKPIGIIYNQSVDPNSLIPVDPRVVTRDKQGTLWIGTSKGLIMINEAKGINQRLEAGMGSWQSNYVGALQEVSNGDIYFGTSKGLAKLPVEGYDDLDFTFYPFKNKNFEGEGAAGYTVSDIFPDGDKHLLLSTNNGISRFNMETETFVSTRDNDPALGENGNRIGFIYRDSKDNIWMGERGSGLRMLPAGSPFDGDHFIYILNDPTDGKSISNDAVTSVMEDNKGHLWVTTYYGLNRLDSFRVDATDTTFYFTRYGSVLGWLTQIFASITQDKNGYLWVGSIGGLYRFDPEAMDIRHYVVPDGLPSDLVIQNGMKWGADGKIYLAMKDGAAWFNPLALAQAAAPPPKPILTEFLLFNKKVPTTPLAEEGAKLTLDKEVPYLDEIRLKYNQSVFAISFAGLDMLNAAKQRFEYQLVGFDDGWQKAGYVNTVTYTNLDPGEYTFQVKASNGDGVWNPNPVALTIIVAPPWYQTWWAYLIFAIIALALIFSFIRYRVGVYKRKMAMQSAELRARTAEAEKRAVESESETRVTKARMEEREQMRKKSAQDFHDETGIKLTRINLLTTTAMQRADDDTIKDCLNQIEHNAQDLTGSMRDFVWALDPQKDSLTSILQRLQDFGNQQFDYSDTTFQTDSSFLEWQDVELDFETKRHVLLVFKEAINNALKYSEAKKVKLKCENTEEGIRISLTDDGKGFDITMKRESYGLKNMQQRAQKIGAKLRVQSAPGNGASIQLILQTIPAQT